MNNSVSLPSNGCRNVYPSFSKSLGSQVAAVYRMCVNSFPSLKATLSKYCEGTGQSSTKLPLVSVTFLATIMKYKLVEYKRHMCILYLFCSDAVDVQEGT